MAGLPCVKCNAVDSSEDGDRDEPGTPTCARCYCEWRRAAPWITFREWAINGVVRTCVEIAGLLWSDNVTISYTPDGVPIEGNERHLSTSEARALAAWLNSAADDADARLNAARAYTQRAHERAEARRLVRVRSGR